MKAVLCMMVPAGVAGGLYLHGDLAGGQVYNVPVDRAVHELSYMEVPEIADSSGMGEGDVRTVRLPDRTVHWIYEVKGRKVGEVVAALNPKGAAQTRVTISFQPGDIPASDVAAQNSAKFAKIVGPVAMQEAVAAAIEDRPFNKQPVMSAMAGYVAANVEGMFQEVAGKMNESIKASEDAERRSEARLATLNAGRPSLDPTPDLKLPAN